MLTLVGPLVLAAISGLAYLAVKHPAVYEKLFNKLYLLSTIVFLGTALWSGAVSMAFVALLPFISIDKVNSAKAAIDGISVPMVWALIGQFSATVYLFFLSWLAHQVKNDSASMSKDA